MSAARDLQRLIRREMGAQRELLVGKCISDQVLVNFDVSGGAGSGVWVIDVEIGSTKPLRKVPIKQGGRERFYAQLGTTVLLRRNANGRYEVIGPGDRLSEVLTTVEYDLTTGSGGAPVQTGFTFVVRPLDYYATVALGQSLWGNGVTPLGLVEIVDAQGNVVP